MSWDDDLQYGQMVIDNLEATDFYNRHLLDGQPGKVRQVTNETIQRQFDIDFYVLPDDPRLGTGTAEQKSVRGVYPKIFIETESCPRTNSPGWIYKSKADTLIYHMAEGSKQRAFFIDMNWLQSFWARTKTREWDRYQMDNNNRSVGYLVPVSILLPGIIKIVHLLDYKEVGVVYEG